MARYWIMPHDMEKVTAYNAHLASQVELYKNYDVSNPQINVHYDSTKELTGAVIYIGELRYLVSYPQENGFVVKRDWSAPDEIDPVLKAWGNYDDVDMFRGRDDTFIAWWDRAFLQVTGNTCTTHQPNMRGSIRLRCFAPRRSKRFAPKITMYQSARDRFEREREVAMKPARAFSMMFPELEHKQIIELTDMYLNRFAVRTLFIKEGTDAKDFVKAYSWTQAPTDNINTTYQRKSSASSCMRYNFEHLPVHPVTAYASGDFKILWSEDADGKIASRCVVRVMPDGQYRGGPIYGVSEQAIDLIEHHINSNGGEYGCDGAWEGARLVRKPADDADSFYAPYLDPEPRRLYDDGKYLVISHDGDIDANGYQGTLGAYDCQCENCGCGLSDDDYYFSEYTECRYCNDCYYDEHFYCEYADADYHIDQSYLVYVPYGCRNGYTEERVSDSAVECGDDFILCDNDDEYWHVDLAYYCEDEDVYISQRAIDADTYFISDGNGEVYPADQKAITYVDGIISIEEAEGDELELDETDGIWKKKEEED